MEHTPSLSQIVISKRFSGLFITQFLTSFNDNFFKNAIIALLNFGVISTHFTSDERKFWVIISGLCFIVPYFIFSATAGKLAEKYNRIKIVYALKYFEVLILGLGGLGFILENLTLMLVMLFCMGVQSTFFSPIKFGILPVYLKEKELIGGNALIEMATFIAIILGTIFGTQIILIQPYGEYIALVIMMITAFIGIYTSYKMPVIKNVIPDMIINKNIISHNIEIFSLMIKAPKIFRYINTGAWFWFVAAVMITILPLYITDVLHMNKDVYTVMLVIFSMGVGLGSVLCARLLDGEISARYTPIAAMLMGVFALDIGYISYNLSDYSSLGHFSDFIIQPIAWRITADFLMLAAAGGFYIVPFFALVQHETNENEKSRMIAGNNIINAIAMVLGGVYMLIMTKWGFSIKSIFITTGLFCFIGSLVVHFMIEDSIIRKIKKKI